MGSCRMGGMIAIRIDGTDVLLDVKVVPGASRTRLVGPMGDRLKVAAALIPEHLTGNSFGLFLCVV